MKQRKPSRKRSTKCPKHLQLQHLNQNATGIDVGFRSHFMAVPEGTDDLERLAEWLICCGVTTVDMESTGIYWIPVFEILELHGLDVKLVNARHVKNVPDRMSDVLDCQWLQQLHTYGLLRLRLATWRISARRSGVYTPGLCPPTCNAGPQCIILYSD